MARKRDGFVSIGDLALDLPGAPVRSTPDRYVRRGLASWYGDAFDGKPTASGEPFDSSQFTTAHYDLPFDSRVRVRNLNNDLVPLEALNNGRILDVSYAAARQLEMVEDGVVPPSRSARRHPCWERGCVIGHVLEDHRPNIFNVHVHQRLQREGARAVVRLRFDRDNG